MGCISSKPASVEEGGSDAGDPAASDGSPQHVVSLTSTTYGLLKLDLSPDPPSAADPRRRTPSPPRPAPTRKSTSQSPPEVINTWELMRGLQDEADDVPPPPKPSVSTPQKRQGGKNPSPTPGGKNPSPSPARKPPAGKENITPSFSSGGRRRKCAGASPNPLSPVENTRLVSTTPMHARRRSSTSSSAGTPLRNSSCSSRRRSLTPMFDPELVATFERELLEEREQIKKVVVSSSPRGPLDAYEPLCPRGGAGAVVVYTTTLRGIRRTFEACNAARAAIEACGVRFIERDISMDHGYREELRVLMQGREEKARVPVVFVKGRLIGGSEELLRLEEEGRLEALLSGIPRAAVGPCTGCGGARFVLCRQCSGSCKVRRKGEEEEVVKCDECNENGLIHCPICCC